MCALSSDNNSLDDLSSLLTDVAVLPSALSIDELLAPSALAAAKTAATKPAMSKSTNASPHRTAGAEDLDSLVDGMLTGILDRTDSSSGEPVHRQQPLTQRPVTQPATGGEPLGTASSALPIDELSALLGEVPAAPQTDERSPRQLVRPSSLGQPELQIPPFAGYEVLAPSDAASIVPANRGYEVVVPGANPAPRQAAPSALAETEGGLR